MDPLRLAFLTMVFLCVVMAVIFVYDLWSSSRFPKRRELKKRLMYMVAGGGEGREKQELYKQSAVKNLDFLSRLAFAMPRLANLDRMLTRAGLPFGASTFIFSSIVLAGLGVLVGVTISPHRVLAVAMGIGLLCLPYLYLKVKEKEFRDNFEAQLPEALDLLARGLRVGHALSSGLEMVAAEMDDPIKSEFSATVVDINLGLSIKEAFDNLCERVQSTDLRFFAISVLIQRETGGNLAKTLDNLSTLIRQRLQFRRKVKALTAEGKISAVILLLLPILMFAYLYFINHDYISLLWTNRTGLFMLCTAAAMQAVGMLVMKKMVTIEV